MIRRAVRKLRFTRNDPNRTQQAYRPVIQVERPRMFLGTNYGGWTICPDSISQRSVVYSFGVGEDISFDLGIIERFGAHVFAFDPTPRSIKWMKQQHLPGQLHFYDFGIADHNGTIHFYPPENPDHVSHSVLYRATTANQVIEVPVKTLDAIVKELGHHRIDILKMDIEGGEYTVIPDIVSSSVEVGQILVEFHHRFQSVDPKDTEGAIQILNQQDYRLFHVSDTFEEFSFIHV